MQNEQEVSYDLIPAEDQKSLESAVAYLDSIKELKVSSDDEENNAAKVVTQLKKDVRALILRRKELVKPHKASSDLIEARYRTVVPKLEGAIKTIGRGVIDYHAEKQRKADAAEKKRQAEADAKADREQEAARKEVEKAKQYDEDGRTEMADKARVRAGEHIEAATTQVAPVEKRVAPEGASFPAKWVPTVEDTTKAVTAMLKNPVYFQFVTIDLKGLEKLAKNLKGNIDIPGITFKKDYDMRNR
jgi:hypothetical protein